MNKMPNQDERRCLMYICKECASKTEDCMKTKLEQCAKEKLPLINERHNKDIDYTTQRVIRRTRLENM